MNHPLQLGTILLTTSCYFLTAYALSSELVVYFALIQTHTEAGEGNTYLPRSGARLEAGTILSKTMNEVILPFTELSNASFPSDRLLLNIRGGVEFFSDL